MTVWWYGAAADREATLSFQCDVETVAGLHHTSIVPIFAIGWENGVNYYATQFIEGQSLDTVGESLRDSNSGHGVTGLLSNSIKVANWGSQAAEALARAHHQGVIHRDINPSNLILNSDDRIVSHLEDQLARIAAELHSERRVILHAAALRF